MSQINFRIIDKYSHLDFSKTFNSVRIAAIPAETSFSFSIIWLKYWQISEILPTIASIQTNDNNNRKE